MSNRECTASNARPPIAITPRPRILCRRADYGYDNDDDDDYDNDDDDSGNGDAYDYDTDDDDDDGDAAAAADDNMRVASQVAGRRPPPRPSPAVHAVPRRTWLASTM